MGVLSQPERKRSATLVRKVGKKTKYSYPIPDKGHARSALARLDQAKPKLMPAERARVIARAKAKLAEGVWDEKLHPRDRIGRWARSRGVKAPTIGTLAAEPPAFLKIIQRLGSRAGMFASHFDRNCARGGASFRIDPKQWAEEHPRLASEASFQWASRIVTGMDPETRHEMIFQIRETYPVVDYVAEGAARYRKERGLPEPKVDIKMVRAPLAKAEAVGAAFDVTPDQARDPVVRAAFEDFKRQNDEMWSFMTRSTGEGGLGIKVTFMPPGSTDEPYESAEAQAIDLRDNHHILVQGGLGGDHTLLTRYQYDRFRAVHDVFGHVGVGGGFDRHGEYQAWLSHMSMYTGPGQLAMSSEYHGVNSSMWAGGSTGTGKSVLLPEQLLLSPWRRNGTLRPEAQGSRPMVEHDLSAYTPDELRLLRSILEGRMREGWEQVTHHTPRTRKQWIFRDPPTGQFGHGKRGKTGKHNFKRSKSIMRHVGRHGGITYQPATNRMPKKGYAVAIPGANSVVVDKKDFTRATVKKFIADNKAWFENPNVFIGAWDDIDGGKVWLELSEVHANKTEARKVADARGEIAMFDLGSGVDIPVTSRETAGLRSAREFSEVAQRAVMAGYTSQDIHMLPKTRRGRQYTPPRAALHDQISDSMLVDGKKSGGKPNIIFAAGGPASGKGFLLQQMNTDGYATIDADVIKAGIPEYVALKGSPQATQFVHEESEDIGSLAYDKGRAAGIDLLVDGAGGWKFQSVIQKAIDAGYQPKVVYINAPADVAQQRNLKRDRTVPEPVLRYWHKVVSEIFVRDIQKMEGFDIEVHDTGGKDPAMIWSRIDGVVKVHDEALFNAFVAKAVADAPDPGGR